MDRLMAIANKLTIQGGIGATLRDTEIGTAVICKVPTDFPTTPGRTTPASGNINAATTTAGTAREGR